jgi:hypothetical protein
MAEKRFLRRLKENVDAVDGVLDPPKRVFKVTAGCSNNA